MKPALCLLIAAILASPLAAETSTLQGRLGTDPGLRLDRLLEALSSADAAACAAWAAEVDAWPACGQREVVRQKVVEAWAALSPREALSYARAMRVGVRFRTPLLESVARGWTRHAPAEAWAWSRAEPPPESGDLPKAVVETAAVHAPDEGLAWIRELAATAEPGDTAPSDLAFAFFQTLVAHGRSDRYREMIEAFPPGDLRHHLLFSITERFAGYRMAEATDWAMSRQDAADAFYPLAGVAVKRTQRDPIAVLEWAGTLKPGPVRAKVINVIAAETVVAKPTLEEADRILAALAAPAEIQAAAAAFAQTEELVRLAPARFLEAAWEIDEAQLRRVSLIRGYAYWSAFDAPAASRHLQSAGRKRPEDLAAVRDYLKGDAP